eukprot:gi/632943727/ref/XP_007887106.1/ PREDICTED: baculoviral IAP repeat-containing protein 7-like [Callorhinchus milii]
MEIRSVITSTLGEDSELCPDCGLPLLCAVTAEVERPERSGVQPGASVSQSSAMCPVNSHWDVAGDEKPWRTTGWPRTREDADCLRSFDRQPRQTPGFPAADLARDGFSSAGFGDEAQRCGCGDGLRTRRPGDRLTSERWRLFPAGVSVSHKQRAGSIPPRGPDTVDGQLLSQLQRLGLEELPVDRANNPAMGTEEARLSTFQNWPNVAAVEPRTLARAGFFYTGHRDNVKCFYCDGGLRNWESGDDPWMEHAKWFPRCDYLLQARGSEYVCSVQQLHADILQSVFQGRLQIQSQRPSTQEAVGNQELDPRMQSAVVQSALQMGFDHSLVESLVDSKYLLTGSQYISITDLLSDLLGAEEEERERREETRGVVQRPSESAQTGAERRETTPTQRGLSAEEQLRRLKEERTCKVCMDKEVSIVFIPCGHLVVCGDCAPNLRRCPICRALIRGSVRAFMS